MWTKPCLCRSCATFFFCQDVTYIKSIWLHLFRRKKKPVRGLDNLVIKDFWQHFSSTRVRIENVLVHFFVSPVYIPSSTAHRREVQDLDNACLFSPCKSLDVLQFHNTSPCWSCCFLRSASADCMFVNSCYLPNAWMQRLLATSFPKSFWPVYYVILWITHRRK